MVGQITKKRSRIMNTLLGVRNKITVPVTPHTNEYPQKNREENCLSKIQQRRHENFLVYKENGLSPILENNYQGSNAENKLTKDVLLAIENDFKEEHEKVFKMIKKPFVIQMDKYGYFFSYACYDHLTDKLVEVQDNLTLSNHAVLSLRSNVENLLKHITHLNSQIFSREGFIYKNYLLGRVVQTNYAKKTELTNYAKKTELKELENNLYLLDTSVSIIANDYVNKESLRTLEQTLGGSLRKLQGNVIKLSHTYATDRELRTLRSRVVHITNMDLPSLHARVERIEQDYATTAPLKVLLDEVSNLKINVQDLENRVTGLEGRVSNLENFKQSTEDRLNNLENVNKVTEEELKYFNNKFWREHEGKHTYSSTVQDIEKLFNEIKSLKGENKDLKNFIAEQQKMYENTIKILVNRVDCLERLPGNETRRATIHDIEELEDEDVRSIK